MDPGRKQAQSWQRNAERWTAAVREGRLASRRAATDEAILQALAARRPKRLLDVGCGEGWLVRRAVALTGCTASGIDGCAPLIAAARAADPTGRYAVLSYRELIEEPARIDPGFDTIVFNFALFDAEIVALLQAASSRLAPGGAVIIQTLHPDGLPAGVGAQDGWRQENFAAFEAEDWTPMPWFLRTLESWHACLAEAGLVVAELREPCAEAGAPPLSLLMVCNPA